MTALFESNTNSWPSKLYSCGQTIHTFGFWVPARIITTGHPIQSLCFIKGIPKLHSTHNTALSLLFHDCLGKRLVKLHRRRAPKQRIVCERHAARRIQRRRIVDRRGRLVRNEVRHEVGAGDGEVRGEVRQVVSDITARAAAHRVAFVAPFLQPVGVGEEVGELGFFAGVGLRMVIEGLARLNGLYNL